MRRAISIVGTPDAPLLPCVLSESNATEYNATESNATESNATEHCVVRYEEKERLETKKEKIE